MCTCEYIRVCMHVCMHACGSQRTTMGVIPQVPFTLFWDRSLTEPRILPLSWILWSVVHVPCPGITSTCHNAQPFHMGSEEHGFTGSTLPSQLSPQPPPLLYVSQFFSPSLREVNLMARRITILRRDRGDIIRSMFCLVRNMHGWSSWSRWNEGLSMTRELP